jgi:peptide-methionine (S)-S-oxide reductase
MRLLTTTLVALSAIAFALCQRDLRLHSTTTTNPAAQQYPMGASSSTLNKMASSASSAPSAASSTIESLITTHPVVIFSKSYCPYCRSAKNDISKAGKEVADFADPHIVELDHIQDGPAIQSALAALTGRQTVPNVFIGGKNAGGGDDISRLANSGVLKQMLRAAPQQLSSAAATSSGLTDALPETGSDGKDLITLGAGCFWGVELSFQRATGVTRTEVGYSNGDFSPVSYDAVCTGRTGHAEVVRVWYDSGETSLMKMLELWEERHDVTSLNKQGNDRGTQYRSAIFYHNDEQKKIVDEWKEMAVARLNKPIVSDIALESGYNAAEPYHQKYLEARGQSAKTGDSSHIRCYG